MIDLSNQISALVDKFVADVTSVARDAAMSTLTAALGSGPAKAAAGVAATQRRAVASRVSHAPKVRNGAGGRRSPEDMARMTELLLEHVRANPGQGIEQIKKAVGFSTAQLSLPMKKLLAAGTVRSQGEKRATRYFPGKKH